MSRGERGVIHGRCMEQVKTNLRYFIFSCEDVELSLALGILIAATDGMQQRLVCMEGRVSLASVRGGRGRGGRERREREDIQGERGKAEQRG